MLFHRQVTPQHFIKLPCRCSFIFLRVERHCESKVSFLSSQHNDPLNLRTCTSRPGVQRSNHQASVVRRFYNAIHWINLCLVDNAIRCSITYPPESNLSVGLRYPPLYNWTQTTPSPLNDVEGYLVSFTFRLCSAPRCSL